MVMNPLNAAQDWSSRLRTAAAPTATSTDNTVFSDSLARGPLNLSGLSSRKSAPGIGRNAAMGNVIVIRVAVTSVDDEGARVSAHDELVFTR
jgi:hypothetical protein